MRRRLLAVSVAATTTVVLAFAVPLARMIRDAARERAVAAAERDAAAVSGSLLVTTNADTVAQVVRSTPAGASGRLAVFLPAGTVIGTADDVGEEVRLGQRSQSPFEVEVDGALLWVRPVALADGDGAAVVRVAIPEEELSRGVARAWLLLALLAGALVVVGAGVADVLARSVTRPAAALETMARHVAAGDLDARVRPSGPTELVRVAAAFNHLAARVADLVSEERVAVADLAHRLGTPLTAMRLDAESIGDDEDRERLVDDAAALEAAVDAVLREASRPARRTTTPVSDIGAVVRERVEFWSALADEQHRPCGFDLAPGCVRVAVPPADLRDMLDALIDNVFTHTPSGVAFSVSVTRGDGMARLVVSDEGPGFARASVVERGTSGDGGSGLGLDIARRTAESGGGTLRVANGPGATVIIELPVVPEIDARTR